jgi:hypothetical protein
VHKKLLVQAAACNLALLLRSLLGAGTPKGLRDRVAALLFAILRALLAYPTHRRLTGEVSDKPTLSHRGFETRLTTCGVEKGAVQTRAASRHPTFPCLLATANPLAALHPPPALSRFSLLLCNLCNDGYMNVTSIK